MKRFISLLLALCVPLSSALAEGPRSVWDSIGGWFDKAAKESSDWVSQAWGDVSSWSAQTWNTVSAWTVRAWEDSSAWVSQAWTDSSTWAAVNWEGFVVWVNRISSGNPYSWMRDVVLDCGLLAYDRFASLRSFLSEDPSMEQIWQRYDVLLSELSLLNQDKRILLETLQRWSGDKGVSVETAAKLALPFLIRLTVEGESTVGGAAITGPVVAQYLFTILETMNLGTDRNADLRLKILQAELEDLVRPVIIGDTFQNRLITKDHYVIENFTYANGKYQIMTIASDADESSAYPMLRGESLEQVIRKYFANAVVSVPAAVESVGGHRAQKLLFSVNLSDTEVAGQAFAVWTEQRILLFLMMTDQAWQEEEVSAWTKSVKTDGENAVSFEADMESDGSFFGVNQGAQKYTINRIFDEERFTAPGIGHGWAAERGNNLIDNIKGFVLRRHSTVIGDNNIKDGPDRLTTFPDGSRLLIQTKYYSTAAQSISACFQEGHFRYVDAEGKPMAIEVPADQYDAAISYMKNRIANGEVPGVRDIEQAQEIVRKGNLTYQQAKHIAKAGTIESILYDTAHACITAGTSMGLSAAVSFAVNLWNGEPAETAIRESIMQGLKTGGTSFIISVLSSQVARTGLNTAMIPASRVIVHALGPKVSAVIVNAFRPAGSAIYGSAAMQSAAKLLRGTAITSAVTFVVLSAGDIADIIQGRISWKQIAKNVSTTAVGITGGVLGHIGGAALGTAILPGAGTLIGIIVSVAAGWGANEGAKAVADMIADDDANEMIGIIESQFSNIALEYFLNEEEVKQSVKNLQELVTTEMLKQMYQYRSHEVFARQLIEMAIDPVVAARARIELPTAEEYSDYLTDVLNEIYEDVSGDTVDE